MLNFELIHEYGLSPSEVLCLLAIRQKCEWYYPAMEEETAKLSGLGLIAKNLAGLWRPTKKGSNFLSRMTQPGATKESMSLAERLTTLYKDSGKDTGATAKEIESLTAWFLAETGFKPGAVETAVSRYLSDHPDYTMSLANLIWKPQSKAFSVHYNLRQSKLFDIISEAFRLDPLPYVEPSKKKETEWLIAVSKLPDPPVNGNPDILFTGDGKKERERLKSIKQYLFNSLRKRNSDND